MNFVQQEFDENDPNYLGITESYVSENGRFEIHVYRVIFGYRVRLLDTKFGRCSYEVDYCAGANREWIDALIYMYKETLKNVDENTLESITYKMFPHAKIKPMFKDNETWTFLCKKANIPTDIYEYV